MRGKPAALPGLLAAIDNHRVRVDLGQYKLNCAWYAALAIALRDNTPATDRLLASWIDRTEILLQDEKNSAEVGATAAGILLAHNHESPERFGVAAVPEGASVSSAIPSASYFTDPAGRAAVKAWWKKLQQLP
jgi:hypothetical protein